MKQFDLYEITRLIEEKYLWGSSSDWTNFHFKELSKAIEEATGDRLSEETLKRIFGKRKVNSENYQPQAFSQLALMKFSESLYPPMPPKEAVKTKRNWKKLSLILIAATVILGISVFIGIQQKEPRFSFCCKNPVDQAPFTATFNYDISEIGDSVFAHFGYSNINYLEPEKKMVNAFFRFPGIFYSKFFTRTKMLDSLKIIAYSNDWEGGYFPNDSANLYEPFVNQTFYRQPDCLYAHPNQLLTEGIDLKKKYYIAYRLYKPFNKSLDSLNLETRVLNNASTGSMLCYDIGLSLIGDSGTIDFKFTQPKCSRYASLRVSEKHFDGKYTDLSALTVDLSDWRCIKVVNENKIFNLYLTDKLIYQLKYEKPLGKLEGVVYYFFGSGKIDYLRMYNNKTTPFYNQDF